jgi:hypothetical protein
MKQAAANNQSHPKMSLSAGPSQVQGFKPVVRAVSPASPPLWNKYIDSRLKQFGTAR